MGFACPARRGPLLVALALVVLLPRASAAQDTEAGNRRYRAAVGLQNGGQFDLAAQAWSEFLEKDPNHSFAAQGTLNLGICQLKSNQLDKALATLGVVIQKYPKFDMLDAAYLYLGLTQYSLAQSGKPELVRDRRRDVRQAHRGLSQGQVSCPGHLLPRRVRLRPGQEEGSRRELRAAADGVSQGRSGARRALRPGRDAGGVGAIRGGRQDLRQVHRAIPQARPGRGSRDAARRDALWDQAVRPRRRVVLLRRPEQGLPDGRPRHGPPGGRPGAVEEIRRSGRVVRLGVPSSSPSRPRRRPPIWPAGSATTWPATWTAPGDSWPTCSPAATTRPPRPPIGSPEAS